MAFSPFFGRTYPTTPVKLASWATKICGLVAGSTSGRRRGALGRRRGPRGSVSGPARTMAGITFSPRDGDHGDRPTEHHLLPLPGHHLLPHPHRHHLDATRWWKLVPAPFKGIKEVGPAPALEPAFGVVGEALSVEAVLSWGRGKDLPREEP